ncbi:amino acid adenylation domain-containing protein [Metabacillus halosaccharovorans]|uniref:amino acid adenylation domain-containing protein n=1 Tax=Metabacillus halosaccharovorans TaxID=930124 RepID=UPI00203B32AE|nr:amino acid adenylation domain-containing protein [Metabacillus halosaccharovorans]MCM3439300.1 amino acid adenylation domain-containing protein [Metabacillus halosaccharovorans]
MEMKQCYETSSAQRRVYIQQQFNPQSIAYNLPTVFKVDGKLDTNRLEEAIVKLIKRHESLRTTFEADLENNDISQIILDNVSFKLDVLNVVEDKLHECIDQLIKPFQLDQAPLFCVKIIYTSEDNSYLFFDIHHIIADGISIQTIMKEMMLLYKGMELLPVDVQYVDYVMWQNDLFNQQDIRSQECYWMRQFKDELPVLDLQTDFVRPVKNEGFGKYVYFQIEKPVINQLKELAREEDATLFMVLFSLYTALLQRYTSQTDIVIGTPIAGRRHAELEPVIGMFVNTLALRIKPRGTMSFRQLLSEVKHTALAAYENQDYPVDQMVEKLKINRSSDRHPLFDTMFVLQNMDTAHVDMDGLHFQPLELKTCSAKFDLTLELTEKDGLISGKLEYNAELFEKQTAERITQHFANIAEQAAEVPDQLLHQFEIMSFEEKKEILEEFNDSTTDFPLKTIAQLFEEQVTRHPDQPAVLYDGLSYTYLELNERANQLARTLHAKGISNTKAVGIMAERSMELIVGMLAVSKTGAAYVPIEPDYPAQRISNMLEDSGSEWLLVQGAIKQTIPDHLEIIDLQNPMLYTGEKNNLNLSTDPNSTAIMIFTSGTSGRPKGIMVTNRGISRLVKETNYVELNHQTRMLQTCALGFDVFTFETWAPLLNGGRLYLTNKEIYLDAEKLNPFLLEHKINLMVPTTALFNHLLNQDPKIFHTLDTIIVGGEVMSPPHVRLLKQNHPTVKLKNGYGPAENTTYTSVYDVTGFETGSIPIGKPISNTSCYVLDPFLQPVPVGVAGELFIGGDGVASGYANRSDLSEEKFITVPSLQGKRVYRTGDLVKWRSDGHLIYLGRQDDQVKIRGYRIELEEINQHVLGLPDVLESVVIPIKTAKKETKLCAYYTAESLITSLDMRNMLMQQLPDFMVPELYMQVEKMPLSANNKINKKALPTPEFKPISTEKQQVEDELERAIAHVWQEVLAVEAIGVNDNFFAVGGQSLKATLVVAKLRKVLNLDIGLNDLFLHPTIKDLAKLLRSKEKVSAGIEVKNVEKRDYYPATSQQTRMMIVDKMKRVPDTSQNITDIYWVEGKLDINRVRHVFQQLIDRHDSLRMSYHLTKNGLMFKVLEKLESELKTFKGTEEQIPDFISNFVQPYDLSEAPLFRIGLIEVANDKQLLIFDIHHSISDGFSLGLLVKEFVTLFHGGQLPKLEFQYKDYAIWQQSFTKTDKWKRQEEFWLKVMKGTIPTMNLPLDFPRPSEKTYTGKLLDFQISEELTERLKQVAVNENTTLYTVLLTAYYTLLYKYSGAEDMIIGAPVAGRNQAEFQQMFGLVTNTLPLRNFPSSHKTWRKFLQEVRETTIQAFENQDYQLEHLLEKMGVSPSVNRNPLFDTIFVLQNMDIPPIDLEGLRFVPYLQQRNTSIIDLILVAKEESGRITFTFEYCTQLFKRETINQMEIHFITLLESIGHGDLNKTLIQLQLNSEKAVINHQYSENLADTFSF